jgi:hypothetical protein
MSTSIGKISVLRAAVVKNPRVSAGLSSREIEPDEIVSRAALSLSLAGSPTVFLRQIMVFLTVANSSPP